MCHKDLDFVITINKFKQAELDYVYIRFKNRAEFYFRSEYSSTKNKKIMPYLARGVCYVCLILSRVQLTLILYFKISILDFNLLI